MIHNRQFTRHLTLEHLQHPIHHLTPKLDIADILLGGPLGLHMLAFVFDHIVHLPEQHELVLIPSNLR